MGEWPHCPNECGPLETSGVCPDCGYGDKSDVEKALDEIRGNKKAKFLLRRYLGKETQYEEINGHIFDPDEDPDALETEGWCKVSSCEMSSPEHAELSDCPAPLESYDFKINNEF